MGIQKTIKLKLLTLFINLILLWNIGSFKCIWKQFPQIAWKIHSINLLLLDYENRCLGYFLICWIVYIGCLWNTYLNSSLEFHLWFIYPCLCVQLKNSPWSQFFTIYTQKFQVSWKLFVNYNIMQRYTSLKKRGKFEDIIKNFWS